MSQWLKIDMSVKYCLPVPVFHFWPVDAKFLVEVVTPSNHSSSQKTRLNDLLYGIKIWTDISFVLSYNAGVWQTDRQTDRQTKFLSLDRVCIPCSAVKSSLSRSYDEKKNNIIGWSRTLPSPWKENVRFSVLLSSLKVKKGNYRECPMWAKVVGGGNPKWPPSDTSKITFSILWLKLQFNIEFLGY